MELIVKKPTFANGVYIVLQLIEKKVYVGESNDIFRRLEEHIKRIAGADDGFYGSNLNLIQEGDKRFALCAVYKNEHYYRKRGYYADSKAPWLYDETIFMFLMRKYGFNLYNNEKDNTGKARSFLVREPLTSPDLDAEKYDMELAALKEKTIGYLCNEMSDRSENKKKIEEDINRCDSVVENIFNELFDIKNSLGVWKFSRQELQNFWGRKVGEIKKANKARTGKDHLSLPYYWTVDVHEAVKYAEELSQKALTKETMELCNIKLLSRNGLAEMIRAKKMDTTIFSPFGAYLGQSAAAILATKTEDMRNNKLVNNPDGQWKIVPRDNDLSKEKGFCEWAFKRLNETDTRKFLETTNTDGEKRKPKYIFFTYTSSKKEGDEVNTSMLNPYNYEKFSEFKARMESMEDIRIGNRICVHHDDRREADIIPIPESIFPELIDTGENRVFLISDLYVLDGYVKDYKKMYECYWAHYAAYSDGKGGECWRVVEDHNYYEGKDKYDKVEKIKEGVYRTYKYHQEVKGGLGHKCGRIRGDDEREKFADLVLSDDFYDVSKKNRDYRNVIVAELIYPYIGTIKKEKD